MTMGPIKTDLPAMDMGKTESTPDSKLVGEKVSASRNAWINQTEPSSN